MIGSRRERQIEREEKERERKVCSSMKNQRCDTLWQQKNLCFTRIGFASVSLVQRKHSECFGCITIFVTSIKHVLSTMKLS